MSAMTRALLLILGLMLLPSDISGLPSGQPIHNQAPERLDFVAIECDTTATSCLSEGNLTHSTGGCHPPLTQGPCPDGQWLVLDLNATTSSALGKCVTLTCPPDSRSRECRRSMQAFLRACPPLPTGDEQIAVHMDPLGQWRCGVPPRRGRSLHAYVRCRPPPAFEPNLVAEIMRTGGYFCEQDDIAASTSLVLGSQRRHQLGRRRRINGFLRT